MSLKKPCISQVLPALEDAEKALAALNKNDIIEIKTFSKPPSLVLVSARVHKLDLNKLCF